VDLIEEQEPWQLAGRLLSSWPLSPDDPPQPCAPQMDQHHTSSSDAMVLSYVQLLTRPSTHEDQVEEQD
jgi:hypothetical protein